MSSIASFFGGEVERFNTPPKKVFHSIRLGFALVLFVVAILYQRRWLIFWATIAQAARAARDSMVGLI